MYNYFPHSSAMRTADDVLTLRMAEGAAGYGIYCMLLELLRDSDSRSLSANPKNLAFALNEPDVALVERVLKSPGLFSVGKDGRFTSPWLEKVMAEFDAKKQAAQEAGRRGAAARYGTKADTNKLPYSNPLGGAMAPPKATDTNIPIQEKKENETHPSTQADGSRSRLLGMSWGGFNGQYLFDLARKTGTPISPLDAETLRNLCSQQRARGITDKNPELFLDMCLEMNLSSEILSFLLRISEGGRTGTPLMKEAVKIHNAWNAKLPQDHFRAKFPADYLLTKLVPLA